jgi:SCY1-like protein 2
MATLSVQEAMGVKVDREAVATLVLPQLWAMSMGPCVYHYSVLLATI